MKIGQKISFKRFISWTGSRVLSCGKNALNKRSFISSISTDTRTLEENDFFIPVAGQNYDGHNYIAEAVGKKCCGFVIDAKNEAALENARKKSDPKIWQELLILQADDNISFLLDLASNYIRRFNPVVIGITGSAGKTTTKDFLVSILSGVFKIVFTPKNFNTEIGIALSALEVNKDAQFFIVELGMRAKGQIGMLSRVVNLDIGAITSIGPSHLEFFKDVSEIALAKSEIADYLDEKGGVLFLNNDDEWTDLILKKIHCKVLKYGRNNNLDYNFLEKHIDSLGKYSFEFFNKNHMITEIDLPVPGFHNIYNACCAAAVCSYLGLASNFISIGIRNAVFGENRMKIISGGGKIIINDCYNASPLSMKRAIDTLKLVSGKNSCRSVAILADMLELGNLSPDLHFQLGLYLKEKGIDILVAIGELSKNICKGYEFKKITGSRENHGREDITKYYHFMDCESFCKNAGKIIKTGDCILIKGSRANRLEKIIDFIQQ